MARRHRQWLFVAPVLLVVGGSGWRLMNPSPTRADGRIVDESLIRLENRLGYHLYAPTWLPQSGRPGTDTKEGKYRVLQDFVNFEDRSILIVAQERRTGERDQYHKERFIEPADARAEINGQTGYFVTGSSGERRLFWHQGDSAVIISSTVLNDDDLVRIARSVK